MSAAAFMAPAGVILLCATIGLATPVRAAGSDTEDAASAARIQKAEDENPRICKRVRPTGSNIAKTYCFRKRVWDKMREDSQQMMRDISERSAIHTGPQEGPN